MTGVRARLAIMCSQLRSDVAVGSSYFEQQQAANPTWSDERVIVAICENVLDEAGAAPPVHDGMLASLCGIAKVQTAQQSVAGMLANVDGRLVATVRVTDSAERRRFTVLHEAGHTLLPGFDRGAVYHRCAGETTHEERLADVAAAELLLPRRFFLPDLLVCGPSLEDVPELAGRYQSSIQAAALRMVNLWPSRIALLAFKHATKPTRPSDPPVARLQWGFTGAGHWPHRLKHKSVAPGSPIDRAMSGELIDETASVDELFGGSVGAHRVQARMFGDTCLVLLTEPEA